MVSKLQTWLSPNFLDLREKSNELREESTAVWVFDESKYTTWPENKSQKSLSQSKRTSCSNGLWICGMSFRSHRQAVQTAKA